MRPPETAPALRANFDTRTTDTADVVKQVSGVRSVMTQDPPGPRTVKAFPDPLETLDEWALLSDGSIAFGAASTTISCFGRAGVLYLISKDVAGRTDRERVLAALKRGAASARIVILRDAAHGALNPQAVDFASATERGLPGRLLPLHGHASFRLVRPAHS